MTILKIRESGSTPITIEMDNGDAYTAEFVVAGIENPRANVDVHSCGMKHTYSPLRIELHSINSTLSIYVAE